MHGIRIVAVVCLALSCAAANANASSLTVDFGVLGASGTQGGYGTACSSNCVLPGPGEQWFTTSGVTVGAVGYTNSDSFGYVTQKPGAFSANGGETGLGESNTSSSPSDPDYEVTSSTWLLIDNTAAIQAGYQTSSFSIESMQNNEGANVYSYSGALSAFNPSQLSLIASIGNPTTGGVTQTLALNSNYEYLVVQATQGDIVVSQEVLNSRVASVPEPGTIALFGPALFGLILMGRRRQSLR